MANLPVSKTGHGGSTPSAPASNWAAGAPKTKSGAGTGDLKDDESCHG